jgi:hypothetical protein
MSKTVAEITENTKSAEISSGFIIEAVADCEHNAVLLGQFKASLSQDTRNLAKDMPFTAIFAKI